MTKAWENYQVPMHETSFKSPLVNVKIALWTDKDESKGFKVTISGKDSDHNPINQRMDNLGFIQAYEIYKKEVQDWYEVVYS